MTSQNSSEPKPPESDSGKQSSGKQQVKRGSNAKRRRGARQKAMQALYQWDFDRAANPPDNVISQFCDMQNMDKVDVEYFVSLFNYSVENIDSIDTEISLHLDRTLDQLDPIERSVLRICCTELKTELGTPYKVVVNEALEISKDFGADKGYRYINGIADKLAASLRNIEYSADHPTGNPLSAQTATREPARREPSSNVKISIKEKPDESHQVASKPPFAKSPASRSAGKSQQSRAGAEGKSAAKPDSPSAAQDPDAPAKNKTPPSDDSDQSSK